MIVNARKAKRPAPAAKPSRPSVTLTAFDVLQIVTPAKTTHTGQGTCQPGQLYRVNEMVSLTPVAATSHQAIPIEMANVT